MRTFQIPKWRDFRQWSDANVWRCDAQRGGQLLVFLRMGQEEQIPRMIIRDRGLLAEDGRGLLPRSTQGSSDAIPSGLNDIRFSQF